MASQVSVPAVGVPRLVKVAAIQYAPLFGQVTTNREALEALVREAAENGAKIIVLPEAAIPGYLSSDQHLNWHVAGRYLEPKYIGKDPEAVAESVPGPSTECFTKLSKDYGIYVTVPIIEKAGDSYFNTICLAGPDGELAAHYRKINPYPPTEQSWASDGDRGIQTVDTEYGRIALAICYDIHTILDDYRPTEPWLLLFSSAWDWDGHPADWFWHEMPERAADYGLNMICANWSATQEQQWRGYGFSVVVSDDGKVLASAHGLYGAEIVYAELMTKPLEGGMPDE